VAVVAAPHAAAAGAAAPDAAVKKPAAAPVAAVAAVVAVATVAAPDAAAAVVGAAVPDALVVAPVPAVAVGAELDAAAAVAVAAVPDALVVAAVPAAVMVAEPEAGAAVALDAAVAVVGSAVAAAFSLSPFPDLVEALGRSRACHRMAWRLLIQAPQPTRSYRPKAVLLFWASANNFYFGADLRSKFVPDESVPTGAQQIRNIDFRSGSEADIGLAFVEVRFTPKSGHCRTEFRCRFVPKADIPHSITSSAATND
jgi:hypothetical protein